jgi:hypothetical protein
MVFWALKTFDQLPKSVGSFLAVDQKFKITQNSIIRTFDQLKRSSEIRSSEKKCFDQTPNLTENFDQLKRSSEIRSSECFPFNCIITNNF